MRVTTAALSYGLRRRFTWLSLLALWIGLAVLPLPAGVAWAAGPTPVTWKWRYEFTEQEEIVLAKQARIAQVAKASGSSLGVENHAAGGKGLATVTVQGAGSLAALKNMIFDRQGEMKRLVMQPSRVRIKGRGDAGKAMVVKIASNIATGYGWALDATVQSAFAETRQRQFAQTAPVVGGSGTQTFFLRADHAGDQDISLRYQRPWQTSSPITGTLDLEVVGELPDTLDLSDLADPSAAATAAPLGQVQPSSTTSVASGGALGTLPAAFDWRSVVGLTNIRDQGSCGSCWSFATVGVLEGAIRIRSGTTTDLSEQFLISCNKNSWSCNGGWMAHPYHQSTVGNLQSIAGAVLESDMPYAAANGSCRTIASHPYTIVSWHEMSSAPSVSEIKEAIHTYGPVSAAICVGEAFQSYTGGIFATDETTTCDGRVNHAIVLVGWNDNDQTWVLRNSWGSEWGESGYMRIRWNTSRVGAFASYVNHQSSCTFNLTPTNATVPAAGTTGSVSVTTQSGCARAASSNVSWVTITSGANSSGSGTVGYRVDPNPGSSRLGTLTIAGKSFTINQQAAAVCTYTIDPISATVSATGGTGSVAVTTQSGCAWSASSNLGWATITSGASGTGNGTLRYSVGPNTGASRNGTMTIAGRSFSLTQAAPTSCTYSLNSLTNNFPQTGGTGSVSVNTGATCAWTAVSTVGWATITSSSSGTGSGTIGFSVAANTGTARTGTITVGGQLFSFTQQGASPADRGLSNGVALNQTMTAATSGGTWQYYYATLPVGASGLSVELSSMSGDVDLYVKRGAKPMGDAFDCSSTKASTINDSCAFPAPESGLWWIGVRNWAIGSLSYTVKAAWHTGGSQNDLGEAVDAPGSTWATGGDANWLPQGLTTHDGVDAAKSGSLSHSQQSWLESSATGPRTLTFWWKVSSESGYDYLRFAVDGIQVVSLSGDQNWVRVSHTIPAGTHALRWSYSKDRSVSSGADAGWVDQVSLSAPAAGPPSSLTVPISDANGNYTISWGASATPAVTYVLQEATNASFTQGLSTPYQGPGTSKWLSARTPGTTYYYRVQASKSGYAASPWKNGGNGCYIGTLTTLADAVDTPHLAWTSGGFAKWRSQTATTHDGVDAAKSGTTGHTQQSWLQTSVRGPRTVTFWWKVSSESGFDYLRFSLDGTQKAGISGERSWAQVSQAIPAGTHALRWYYSKDGSVSSGSDAGWLDQVRFSALSTNASSLPGSPPLSWQQLSVGAGHTVATRSDGSLWAWGANSRGQLGDGSAQDRLSPVRIGAEQTWVHAQAGGLHTLAIKRDGSLWAWGDNRQGQLGAGSGQKRSLVPRPVEARGEWHSLGLGRYHSVAIRSDGSLWAWGDNRYGQLGDGTVDNRFTPVRIGTESDWIEVVAGLSHTLALKQDGSLWAWGDNSLGQLGDGSMDNRYLPVRIGRENDWQLVAAGGSYAMALKNDGSLWSWGRIGWSQAGDNAATISYTPERIDAGDAWLRIAAGPSQAAAIKADGTLWSWGDNAAECGNAGPERGTFVGPVQMGREAGWTAVAAGACGRTAAISDEGVILRWGDNAAGQPDADATWEKIDPNQLP